MSAVTVRLNSTHCLQEINPNSGFRKEHRWLCVYCDSDAVVHADAGYWCSNVCAACAASKCKGAVITAGLQGLEVV